MSDICLDQSLAKAQALLWGGSETENIEAHNLIANLIKEKISEYNWTQPSLFDTIKVTTARKEYNATIHNSSN
jgi:hypothetical protein